MPVSSDTSARPVKTPGPDHPITVEPHPRRVVVKAAGKVVADTRRALALREAAYPAVLYIPREDADLKLFAASARHTTCPHKGVASYFHLRSGADGDDNAVWSYETPIAGVEAIAGRLAFYANKV